MGRSTDELGAVRPHGSGMTICWSSEVRRRQAMSTPQNGIDRRRFRLATNDNETIVVDRADHRRFRLAGNQNETTVTDELDTEGHRLATNDNETVVEDAAPSIPKVEEGDSPTTVGEDDSSPLI
jgi:hypothetical protein